MTCLLAEGYNLRAAYLSRALKRILKRGMSVAVIAFSFRESAVRSAEDFQRLWGEGSKNHTGIVSGLTAYGIAPEDISFLNYFTDTKESAAALLRSADVLYFPGGVPDQMTERIREFALEEIIRAHRGVFIGYSAGALALLSEYVVNERLLTDGEDYVSTEFNITLKGEDSKADVISRSVARGNSKQSYVSKIEGLAKCTGHTECDAILTENGSVDAVPCLSASSPDASLIHEAAIGKIAGEQLIKLCSLGLTREEAEKKIIEGFLK